MRSAIISYHRAKLQYFEVNSKFLLSVRDSQRVLYQPPVVDFDLQGIHVYEKKYRRGMRCKKVLLLVKSKFIGILNESTVNIIYHIISNKKLIYYDISKGDVRGCVAPTIITITTDIPPPKPIPNYAPKFVTKNWFYV